MSCTRYNCERLYVNHVCYESVGAWWVVSARKHHLQYSFKSLLNVFKNRHLQSKGKLRTDEHRPNSSVLSVLEREKGQSILFVVKEFPDWVSLASGGIQHLLLIKQSEWKLRYELIHNVCITSLLLMYLWSVMLKSESSCYLDLEPP